MIYCLSQFFFLFPFFLTLYDVLIMDLDDDLGLVWLGYWLSS